MSVTYLRAFLDASEALPFDVQPHVTEYREKDAEFQKLKEEITETVEKILDLEGSVAAIQHLEILQGLVTKASAITNEKLQLANNIAEVTDKQHDALEQAANDFSSGAYVQKEKKAALAAQEKAAPRKSKQHTEPSEKPATKRKRTEKKKPTERKVEKEKEKEKGKESEFCVPSCKVSGEEMVGCDNGNCNAGQWFHYSCVGLKTAPSSSTWYCQWCRPKFSKKR